ncbi:CNH domain-containing protein [Russula dissimulans]|nr:CNH domain-containing protein [Russula dissimulans]
MMSFAPTSSFNTTNPPGAPVTTTSSKDSEVFQVETLSLDTFAFPSTLGQRISQWWKKGGALSGRVTCSAPFTSTDGRAFLAVGCAEGVWIGFRHDPRSLRRVLFLKKVTQCAALDEFGLFLVLADKSLFAYDIEALVPSSPQSARTSHLLQKLNRSKDVQFFRIGRLEGRTLVICMTTKKGSNSVFTVLEPTVGMIHEWGMTPVFLSSRLSLPQSRSQWFSVDREVSIPSKAYDVIFLGTRIAILCKSGFELVELSDLRTVTLPLCENPRQKKLAKRCRSCRPMGMFRSNKDEYLLCYDSKEEHRTRALSYMYAHRLVTEFGLYVNARGEPSPTKDTIEWNDTAEHVAWYPPYVLIFNSHSIEVRHVSTGRLCHMIHGHDIQCTWDGCQSLISQLVPDEEAWGETPVQGAHVYGVMRADNGLQERTLATTTTTSTSSPSGSARGVVHRVFELVPTLPISRFEEPWTLSQS